MGNKATRSSGETKEFKEAAKKAALQTTRELAAVQVQAKDKNMVVASSQKAASVDHFVDVAIQQVDRGDKPLTKADLVAIVVFMKPDYINKIQDLQETMTTKDLNALIRNTVYNPTSIAASLQVQSGPAVQSVKNTAVLQLK